jgi:hypothetical protein
VVAASDVSPAETRDPSSAWGDFVRVAGFGVTLPLQACLALRATKACLDASPATTVVNACFPDAVNPVLHAAGLPVACGLGNVATLASGLRGALLLHDESRLKVLAHHVHLHTPNRSEDEAVAWLDEQPLTALPRILAQMRTQPRSILNEIGAVAGADVVVALARRDAQYAGHVPAPNGLPGGYPVLISNGSVALRLPPGMPQRQAVAHNHRWSAGDGVLIDDHGKVRLTQETRRALTAYWPDAPDVFGAHDIEDLQALQLALRDDLRRRTVQTRAPAR